MAKMFVPANRPTLTPEQVAERNRVMLARLAAKPAYKMPEVCRHGFPKGETDSQGCPAGD